jgi:hypothetical protein
MSSMLAGFPLLPTGHSSGSCQRGQSRAVATAQLLCAGRTDLLANDNLLRPPWEQSCHRPSRLVYTMLAQRVVIQVPHRALPITPYGPTAGVPAEADPMI